MTRKDFQFIADTIASIRYTYPRIEAARAFASQLGRTNPAFKRHLFLAACGVTQAELDADRHEP